MADGTLVGMAPATTPPWARPAAEVAEELGVDPTRGLGAGEASARLAAHGPNELAGHEDDPIWRSVVAHLTGGLTLVLLAAAAVTVAVGELLDATVILAIVVLDTGIGVAQEQRAAKAMAALRDLTAAPATVRRDGTTTVVPAADVVPGDVLLLVAGDVVAADARVLDAAALGVDESSLTGESEPVRKSPGTAPEDAGPGDRVGLVHRGTAVTAGHAEAVVVGTGSATELGRIAALLGDGGGPTPLQRRLAVLARQLAVGAIAVSVLVFLLGLARGEDVRELLLTAVSLAVAAIPEGLPAVVTVALALGARRAADRRALVRHLPAVETLGSVTVVCTDKTGTLTENRMAVERLWTPTGSCTLVGEGYAPTGDVHGDPGSMGRAAAVVAASCNDAEIQRDPEGTWTLVGDPTEGALLAMAARLGLADGATGPRVAEVPFDERRRSMTTVHAVADEGLLVATKGAVEVVLDRCRLDAPDRDQAEATAAALAEDGFRVLALARRRLPAGTAVPDEPEDLVTDLELVGIVGIVDPPRRAVPDAVARCRAAGTVPVMITGDHPRTARAIGRRLGFLDDGRSDDGAVLTGPELDALDDDALAERIRAVRVHARVTPEQKLRIVRALQADGEVVAMTGDGVNDAPALQAADIGVAMGVAGTEVAKEAADVVLADDDFATIVAAIGEGRRIDDNVRRVVRYLLATNVGELLVVLAGPLLGLPVPLTAAQILWVNLVTDGLPAVALGTEPASPGAMARGPRPPGRAVLGDGVARHALVAGLAMAGTTLAVLALARTWDLGWRSATFTTLAGLQLVNAIAVRSRTGRLPSRALAAAVGLGAAAQLAVVGLPGLQTAFDVERTTVGGALLVAGALAVGALVLPRIARWDDDGPRAVPDAPVVADPPPSGRLAP